MRDFAILCPGQGTQHPTMFDLATTSDAGRAVVDAFGATLSIDFLARTRADDALFANDFAQPALVAVALATWRALEPLLADRRPAAFAGYSVGELSAWACAGAWTVDQCAALARQRALAMDRYGPSGCGMLAVRGLSIEAVRRASHPGVAIAIVSGADDLVVAGPGNGLDVSQAAFLREGAMTRRLDVRIPSHTGSMRDAAAAFEAFAVAASVHAPSAQVLRGVDGIPLHAAGDAVPALTRAICEPIRWDACQRTLVERGIRVALALGPGRSLAGLAAEHAPEVVIRSVDDFRTLEGVAAWLRRSTDA